MWKVPHGITLRTEHLCIGTIIHIDLYLMLNISICSFTFTLLFIILTPIKSPHFSIATLFLAHYSMQPSIYDIHQSRRQTKQICEIVNIAK